jgi:hypothetical protein
MVGKFWRRIFIALVDLHGFSLISDGIGLALCARSGESGFNNKTTLQARATAP